MLVSMPVIVCWSTNSGLRLREHASTEIVSSHGVVLKANIRPAADSLVTLTRPVINRTMKARVVSCTGPEEDGLNRVSAEFLEVDDGAFWGITFPPEPEVAQPASVRSA